MLNCLSFRSRHMERLPVKNFWWLHLFCETNQSGRQELHWYKNLDSLNTLQKMKASRKLSIFLIHNRLYIYRKPLLKCTRLQYFPCQLFKVFPRAFLLPTLQASFSQFSLEFHYNWADPIFAQTTFTAGSHLASYEITLWSWQKNGIWSPMQVHAFQTHSGKSRKRLHH